MPLLKFSNKTKDVKLNERIITPNSIPIFVLPPTLDSCKKQSPTNEYLSLSTQNVNKVGNTIAMSSSLHDIDIVEIEEKRGDDKKSHSLPYVAVNGNLNSINSIFSKIIKNKTAQAIITSGLFHANTTQNGSHTVPNGNSNNTTTNNNNVINITQENHDDTVNNGEPNGEKLHENYSQFWLIDPDNTTNLPNLSTISSTKQHPPLLSQTHSSNTHYLTTDYDILNTNKRNKSTRSAKSLNNPDSISRNSLTNYDPNRNLRNKTRSKSETLIAIPNLLAAKPATSNTNNDKRHSYNASINQVLVRLLNDKHQAAQGTQNGNGTRFSLRNLFKINHDPSLDSSVNNNTTTDIQRSANFRSSINSYTKLQLHNQQNQQKRYSIVSARSLQATTTTTTTNEDHLFHTTNKKIQSDATTSNSNSANDTTDKRNTESKSLNTSSSGTHTDTNKQATSFIKSLFGRKTSVERHRKSISSFSFKAFDRNEDINIDEVDEGETITESEEKKPIINKFQRHSSLRSSIISRFGKLKNRKNLTNQTPTNQNGQYINAFIDIEIHYDVKKSKLQVQMFNLCIQPLMELNEIKAKLTYILYDKKDSIDDLFNTLKQNDNYFKKKSKIFEVKKIKFDSNLRNTANIIEFSTLNTKLHANNNANENCKYLHKFILSIEIHSYLPISRKTLQSTFRKMKRIFKGKLIVDNININENEPIQYLSKQKFALEEQK